MNSKQKLEKLILEIPGVKKVNLDGLIIAVDFDGTCVTHEYPRIGREIGAVPVLKYFVERGAKLILWTMRSGKELKDAEKWFDDNKIPLFGSQRNPLQDSWTSSPKAYAHIFIDDSAFGCPLIPSTQTERAYVDWGEVGRAFGFVSDLQIKCFEYFKTNFEGEDERSSAGTGSHESQEPN